MIVRVRNNTVYKLSISSDKEKEFLKRNPKNNDFDYFLKVDKLPESKHNFWKIENGEIISDEVKNNVKDIELAKTRIKTTIYTHNNQEQQTQDGTWVTYGQNAIRKISRELGTPNSIDKISDNVTDVVLDYWIDKDYTKVSTFVSSQHALLQDNYRKLIEIGIRQKWSKEIYDEGILAIKEGREPNYEQYPLS